MKILFLAPYPEGESPSQRFRLEHYLPLLKQASIQYDYKPFLGLKTWKIFFRQGYVLRKMLGLAGGYLRRWWLMFFISRYDFVYIHREAAPLGPPIFEWIIARLYRKKVIYDFDDAIWIPIASSQNSMALKLKWFGKVKTICSWSYKVSTGNEFLANFALKYNPRTVVIPTVVDTEHGHNRLQKHTDTGIVVGWTGTFSTLKYLDIVLKPLQRMQENYDFTFLVIANKDPELPLKNYRFIHWQKEREIDDLLKIHIGLMPLLDNDIEKGKCGFKAIQYLALGIPALVSPVSVNSEIIEDGKNGFLCSGSKEWEEKLELLLADKQLRERMGANGIETVCRNYSVESTKQDFLNLFS